MQINIKQKKETTNTNSDTEQRWLPPIPCVVHKQNQLCILWHEMLLLNGKTYICSTKLRTAVRKISLKRNVVDKQQANVRIIYLKSSKIYVIILLMDHCCCYYVSLIDSAKSQILSTIKCVRIAIHANGDNDVDGSSG